MCEFTEFLKAIGASNIKIDEGKKSNINTARASRNDIFEYYGQLTDGEIDAFVRWFSVDCAIFNYDCEQLACEIKEWKRRNSLQWFGLDTIFNVLRRIRVILLNLFYFLHSQMVLVV